MSKIICDICGTTYQDTAECCPICGCTRDAASALLGEDLLAEEIVEEPKAKSGRFAPQKKKEIFDFDEVNAEPEDEEEEEEEEADYDEEEEEEEAPRHNTLVVILLTILIAGLLIAAGFIFVRYFLPNMSQKETVPPATVQQVVETTAAPTEAGVPCESLYLVGASKAELNQEGQYFLLNVKASPENTTDKIIYTSGNDSIATVTEDGRITAVSEGETVIYISCGKVSSECPVVVKYVEETVPPTTEAPAATEADPAETTAPTSAAVSNPDVVLKLKKTDIRLGVYYYTTLELDCDLDPTQVEWTSEHPHIATVDEKGVVTAVKAGTTIVTAKYGDQVVECWIRCV